MAAVPAAGKVNEEAVAEVTFTLRASDKTADVAPFPAQVGFTRAGCPTFRYTAVQKGNAQFTPHPIPDGKAVFPDRAR